MGYDKIGIFPATQEGYDKVADLVLEQILGEELNVCVPKILRELLWWKNENEQITIDDLDMLLPYYDAGDISQEQEEEINNYLYSTYGIRLSDVLQKRTNKQKIKEMGFEEETFQRLLEILKDEDFREIFLIEGNTLEDKIQNIYYSFKQEELTKLLFCVAMRYEEVLEEKNIAEEEAVEHHETLEIIKRNLEPNSKMIFKYQSGQKKYSYSALEFVLKRFETKEEGKTQYISKTKMKEEILEGKRTINGLSAQEYALLGISLEEEKEMLKTNPENYIFFLKQSKCKYNCAQILQDIINAKACSEELFKYLCQRTDITTEEICNLFDQNIITEEYIKIAKEILSIKTGRDVTIISTEKLETVYLEYKEANNSEEKEEAGKRFERYASVYRNVETCGKTREELNKKGNEFILSVVEDDEEIIQLYSLGIIPIDAVVLSSDELLEVLLTREQLKPIDAEYLKRQGKYTIDDLIEKFGEYPNMSYEYQLALVAAMCDDKEEERCLRALSYSNRTKFLCRR